MDAIRKFFPASTISESVIRKVLKTCADFKRGEYSEPLTTYCIIGLVISYCCLFVCSLHILLEILKKINKIDQKNCMKIR